MLTGMISKMYWNITTRYKCLLPFVRGEKIYMHSIFVIASRKDHGQLHDQRWKEIYFSLYGLSEPFIFLFIKNV